MALRILERAQKLNFIGRWLSFSFILILSLSVLRFVVDVDTSQIQKVDGAKIRCFPNPIQKDPNSVAFDLGRLWKSYFIVFISLFLLPPPTNYKVVCRSYYVDRGINLIRSYQKRRQYLYEVDLALMMHVIGKLQNSFMQRRRLCEGIWQCKNRFLHWQIVEKKDFRNTLLIFYKYKVINSEHTWEPFSIDGNNDHLWRQSRMQSVSDIILFTALENVARNWKNIMTPGIKINSHMHTFIQSNLNPTTRSQNHTRSRLYTSINKVKTNMLLQAGTACPLDSEKPENVAESSS